MGIIILYKMRSFKINFTITILIFFILGKLSASETETFAFIKVWNFYKFYSEKSTIEHDKKFAALLPNILKCSNSMEINDLITNQLFEQNIKIVEPENIEIEKFTLLLKEQIKQSNRDAKYLTDFTFIDILSETNKYIAYRYMESFLLTKKKSAAYNFETSDKIWGANESSNFDGLDNTTQYYLSVAKFYGLAFYIYPYRSELHSELQKEILEILRNIPNLKDKKDYFLMLQQLASLLQDAHSEVVVKGFDSEVLKGKRVLISPIMAKYDDKGDFVIGKFFTNEIGDNLKLKQGMLITQINGLSVADWKKKLRKHSISSGNVEFRQKWEENEFYLYLPDNTISIEVEDNNVKRVVEFDKIEVDKKAFEKSNYFTNKIDNNYFPIDKNSYYIDLYTLSSKQLKKAYLEAINYPNLVIDFRSNPIYTPLGSFIYNAFYTPQEDKTFAIFHEPSPFFPGCTLKTTDGCCSILDNKGTSSDIFKDIPRYKGNIIGLIDWTTSSSTETDAMPFKRSTQKIVFIGRPTAGVNGDAKFINLPLDSKMRYSSIDFDFPNQVGLQNKGILPDIYMPRLYNINSKSDRIFEFAMEYLKKQNEISTSK